MYPNAQCLPACTFLPQVRNEHLEAAQPGKAIQPDCACIQQPQAALSLLSAIMGKDEALNEVLSTLTMYGVVLLRLPGAADADVV